MDWYHQGKRIFDLACSSALLTLNAPLMLGIGAAIKLTSKGPVVFKQQRTGYQGKPFTMYKFRTMETGSERHLDLVERGDPRVTKVGTFLRASHLDELPQLINVIKGDMSMVGPRPDVVSIADHLALKVPGYVEALDMMPGLTGLSQLCGRERVNRIGRHFEVRLHRWYRRNRSLAYDALLVLATIPHMLLRRGV